MSIEITISFIWRPIVCRVEQPFRCCESENRKKNVFQHDETYEQSLFLLYGENRILREIEYPNLFQGMPFSFFVKGHLLAKIMYANS